MNSPTPEEIKRHAINFHEYINSYDIIYEESIREKGIQNTPNKKSLDKLYEDFTSGKPASL